MLVGVNLLREGLDLPEVSLVAILDADKEGFLRGETSLIQTIGRAARNVDGTVLMYADKETDGDARGDRRDRPPPRDPARLQRGARHHRRRRSSRASPTSPSSCTVESQGARSAAAAASAARRRTMRAEELERTIVELEEEMLAAADELRFEYAARLRDELRELRRELEAVRAMGLEAVAED